MAFVRLSVREYGITVEGGAGVISEMRYESRCTFFFLSEAPNQLKELAIHK